MPETQDLLFEVERMLKKDYKRDNISRVPSTAREAAGSPRIDQLILQKEERPKMPYTKDKYLVRENPHKVAWERVTREFLRNLSVATGHRVSAVMVFEWATGIKVKEATDLARKQKADDSIPEAEKYAGPSPDLRKINEILRFYFGKSYMTYIMGRKTPNCYRVPPGYHIRRHRPMTLTLYAEYAEGTLYP